MSAHQVSDSMVEALCTYLVRKGGPSVALDVARHLVELDGWHGRFDELVKVVADALEADAGQVRDDVFKLAGWGRMAGANYQGPTD